MKQLTSSQVRSMFLEYFKENGHMVEPGASLVPHNDPTLLWINAGVAALKKYFDGSEKPKCDRITNAQKCIRTNDIENVGRTARHHTFFEMLGNFSIGDYFKEEAIPFAWEFLTSPKWIGFDKERLYVTVYPDDHDAYRIWTEKCGMNPSHILKTMDNFWEIGKGPGGPDSEIFYDRGPKYDPLGLGEKLFFEEMENDRYVEIWNVVFSQFDCDPEIDRKDYKELPHKNIDTGMGLERLVAVIQDGETNFDTDLFLPIIHEAEKLAKHPYEGEYKMAYRVIADHIRTVTFALADGAMFSNEGRGYVLRRVLRRAVRYGIKIGISGAFMYQLVSVVAENMNDFYPYLSEKVAFISKLVKNEEEAFHATLSNGEKLLNEVLENNESKVLSGEVMFKLYDTYGYPKELTAEIAEEKGFTIDIDGFNREMEKQRERARNARGDEQSMASQSKDLMEFENEFDFTGYKETITSGKVTGLFISGVRVDEISDEGDVIFDQSCFYAESGGQIADSGMIIADGFKAKVLDCKKAPHKQHLHHIEVIEGSLKEGMACQLKIDEARRNKIMANHSALHLLDSALRIVLGSHVAQAGSYVCDEYGRFDFTHFEKVTMDQLEQIELMINEWIGAKYPVKTEILNIEEAKRTGAIALFDEKYGDTVRVVSMGEVSKEFCGGTHVNNTQEVGMFKIVSEESIGSGIRRITVKSGLAAYLEMIEKEKTLKKISKSLKMNSLNNVDGKVDQVLDELSQLKKEKEVLNERLNLLKAKEMANKAVLVNELNILITKINPNETSDLKNLAQNLTEKANCDVAFLYSVVEERVSFAVSCSKSAVASGLKAGNLVKEAAMITGGNGGGRPDLAQAGGKDVTKIEEAVKTIQLKLGLPL